MGSVGVERLHSTCIFSSPALSMPASLPAPIGGEIGQTAR
jgi:hypothetical protein